MPDSWSDRACLITGGAGFGGAHLCEALLRRGARVFVLDQWLPHTSYLSLRGLADRVELLTGDVRDLGLFRNILERFEIDIVFHLAAQPIVLTSNVMPMETLSINVTGTYAVLEAIRTASAPPGLVFASSGAYYGASNDGRALREDDAPRPATNIYAASKVAADFAVLCYAATYGIRAAVCRFVNTYGPGDTNLSRLIPHAIDRLVRQKPYQFRDDGTTRLDYLHVADMASGYILTAEHLDSVAGEAFNFGAGIPITTAELVRLVSRVFDGTERHGDFRGPPRPIPVVKYLDTTKAREMLGWTPAVDLERGLAGTIEWRRGHAG